MYFVPNDWSAERNKMLVLERGAGRPETAVAQSGGGLSERWSGNKNRLECGAEIKKGPKRRSANTPGRPPRVSQ